MYLAFTPQVKNGHNEFSAGHRAQKGETPLKSGLMWKTIYSCNQHGGTIDQVADIKSLGYSYSVL